MVASRGMGPANAGKLGLFSEMGYTTIGEPYQSNNARPYNEAASKGKQMMTAATKTRTALGDGYFTHEFKRVFDKEAYSDPVKRRRQDRIEKSKKNLVNKPFLPSDYSKQPSGTGSYFGTFGLNGQVGHKHFSAQTRDKPPHTSPPKNFIANPPKKGSGYGYVSVTIGEYAKAMSDKADRFHQQSEAERKDSKRKMVGGAFKLAMHPKTLFQDNPFKADKALPPSKTPKVRTGPPPLPFKPTSPPKRMGNNKDGTFTKYPTHPVDGYGIKAKRPVGPKFGVFNPPTVPKSRPTDSLVRRSVVKQVNIQNYTAVSSVF